MEKMPPHPVNLGSGKGVSIRQLVEIILDSVPHAPAVEWDTSQPSGDASRLMDISRALALGFEPAIGLAAGIREVVEWFQTHRGLAEARHNVFRSAAYI
jgi:GDP-L-fucose synthase